MTTFFGRYIPSYQLKTAKKSKAKQILGIRIDEKQKQLIKNNQTFNL